MRATTRIDLHCHSVHSDGTQTPREIAEQLSADGVVAAALADHDSIDGLAEFSRALARRQVGYITGVEITTQMDGREIHLLAYGFDPSHSELRAVLTALRHAHPPDLHSIAGSIRRKGLAHDQSTNTHPGTIEVADAIALVHKAGGRAFLAHPLLLESDPQKLEQILTMLKGQGLDGIEAVYAPFSQEDRTALCAIAGRLGLLVSGGTDTHDRRPHDQSRMGVEVPTTLWKEFRDAVGVGATPSSGSQTSIHRRYRGRFNWRGFAFHFLFPTVIAITLFISAIYAVFLPTFEKSLMDRKREMIRELTNSAWSILAGYERDVQAGRLTRIQAQSMAKERIQLLRYGVEGKDYFWIQDMQPRMIMHPYRKDLNGTDVSNFRDPRGKRIFVEFADLVKRGREGYADYVWQWKDDPSRLVPKESYIKGFQPWGWIIGTGIYVEDVAKEIKQIERSLVRTSLGISLVVILLLLYVMRQTLWLERERADIEESLYESNERYRALVEAATEGTLLVTEGRYRYGNPTFLEMIGCTQEELELLDLPDLFPETKENDAAWQMLNSLLKGGEADGGFDAVLRRRDGTLIECVIGTSRISLADRNGFILLVRSVSPTSQTDLSDARDQRWQQLRYVANNVQVGMFRAKATSRGTLTEYSRTALQLLRPVVSNDNTPLVLADIFNDAAAYDDFLVRLQKTGEAEQRLHITTEEPSARTIAIAAVLVRDEHGSPRYIDAVVQDITDQERHEGELKRTIEKLQTSLLFLHEPVSQIGQSALYCGLDTPVRTLAVMMTDRHASAALVQSEAGNVVGIVTDGDIRGRIVAANANSSEQVHRIMSSPLVTIPERAQIYEALLLMERKDVQHLAIADESGHIVGIVRNQELLQFRSYGAIVINREIQQAESPEEIAACCRRVPDLAKALLDSGAHPHHVTRMITSICDTATVTLIDLAEKKLGPPPVTYAFLALGSHGREEMTLASDQDNAIVYEATEDADQNRVKSYLNELGLYVCEGLNRAGYPLCKGNVMAQNPKWCQPIDVWKQYFSEWIALPEPQQLLEFAIFFDFRVVHGSQDLANDLRHHVFMELRTEPAFYPHLAHNSLLFKPPARLFGRILTGTASAEHHELLDLKDVLMPIVSFARLYALRLELDETHTQDRLEALAKGGVLTESSAQDIISAYTMLMRLRLQHHADMLTTGQLANNTINYRRLTQIEQTMLNQSFAQISAVQKRISFDYLGGTA